jgi:citrate lyase synthetase
MMEITQQQLKELQEVVEDTVEYACDKHMISGELAWTVINCLAVSKLAELEGLIKA